MMAESDEALLRRAVTNDEDALAELLARHGPALRARLAHSIGPQFRSSLDADDVMQVTYLEAFLWIGRLSASSGAGFAAWLRQIAENNVRDAVRALEAGKRPNPRRRVHAPADAGSSMVALVELLGVTSSTPSRAAAAVEAQGALERALGELPPDYELVVRRYDLEGQAIERVAAELGRSEGAVYMLRARAHDRLREFMGAASQFFSQGS